MTSQLHFPLVRIVLPAADDWSELPWYGFAAGGAFSAQGTNLPADLPTADALEIVLPARRVSVHSLTLPAQAGKHLDALIAQALEDRLLGDKTDALIIPGPQHGTERRVWVCSRRWLENGLEKLVVAGQHPDRLLPEQELLPPATEISGTGAGSEATAEATIFASTPSGTLFRTAAGKLGLFPDEATLRQLTSDAPLLRVEDTYRRPWPSGCGRALPKALSRFARQSFDRRVLYRPLALLGMSAALMLLGAVIHWRQLENREARLQHEIRQTFATAFPGTPIVDPVLQWESKQREASQTRTDALDAVLKLAARLNAPIRPRRIEAGDGFVRLVVTDSEFAQFRTQLFLDDGPDKPETSPAEPGLTRLSYLSARTTR